MKDEYTRNAIVTKIVDGDTVDLLIDLGFSIAHEHRVRLHGINAPERGQDGWSEATAFLSQMIPTGSKVIITTHKPRDKYGRYLADIYKPGDLTTVNERMILAQVAKPYLP